MGQQEDSRPMETGESDEGVTEGHTLSLSNPMCPMLFLKAAIPLGPEPSLSAELRERLRTLSFSTRMSLSNVVI